MKASDIESVSAANSGHVSEWGIGLENELAEQARLNATTFRVAEATTDALVDVNLRLTALEEHPHEAPDQPILIGRTYKTEPWLITEPGEYKNVTVHGVKDHAVEVRADNVTLEDFKAEDCHGAAVYTHPRRPINGFKLLNSRAYMCGTGAILHGENNLIDGLEVRRIIKRTEAGMQLDTDGVRGWGSLEINRLWVHDNRVLEIGDGHGDGFQFFNYKDYDYTLKLKGSNWWIDKVHQGIILSTVYGHSAQADLTNCIFAGVLGKHTPQTDDDGWYGVLAKGSAQITLTNCAVFQAYYATYAKNDSLIQFIDSLTNHTSGLHGNTVNMNSLIRNDDSITLVPPKSLDDLRYMSQRIHVPEGHIATGIGPR